MRIVWTDYIKSQMAWWSSLNKLANDPKTVDPKYMSVKARAAFSNARSVSGINGRPSRSLPRPNLH